MNEVLPFANLANIPEEILANGLAPEHPQTIAVVLAWLPVELSVGVLKYLPAAADILIRMKNLKGLQEDILRALEGHIERKFSSWRNYYRDTIPSPGKAQAEAILNRFSPEPQTGQARASLPDNPVPFAAPITFISEQSNIPGWVSTLGKGYCPPYLMEMITVNSLTFARLNTTLFESYFGESRMDAHPPIEEFIEETLAGFSVPSLIMTINMDPLPGTALIEIEPRLSYAILELMLGGSGTEIPIQREHSNIEIDFLEGLVLRILANLRASWELEMDLRPRLGSTETNPFFAKIYPEKNRMIKIPFDVRIQEGNTRGRMHLVLDSSVWSCESFMSLIDREVPIARVDTDAITRQIEISLDSETFLSGNQLAHLSPGDLIRLGPAEGQGKVRLNINGECIAFGTLSEDDRILIIELVQIKARESLEEVFPGK